MQKTKINWCDYSWNPITGCTKIASGCKFCYAESIAKRFWGDRKFSDVQFHPEKLNDPKLRSKKPLRIFVNSMSDLFHELISFEIIEKIILEMGQRPQHTFLILTKRAKRMAEFFEWFDKRLKDFGGYELPNFIHLGYSASTQKDLDAGIDYLQKTNAKVKWLSLEPLIEPVVIYPVDWIVVGCESGSKRRYCENVWIEDIVNDCKEKNIPVWVKQIQMGLKREVTDYVDLFPEELQRRQLPKVI